VKLLMTADAVGGVWSYALELARALRALDVDIVLATQGAPLGREQRRAATRLENVRLEESVYRLEWMAEPWSDLRRGDDWLLELEAKHSPDIVHLNDLTRGGLPWRAPALIVAHSCVLSWWRAVKREPAPAEWAEYRRRVTASLCAADLVVAPSAAMLAALQRHYGPLAATRVLHNGRDPARFPIGEKESFVFAAGRVWDEGKNLAALGRVAAHLEWPVFIAGDARHPDGGVVRCGRARLVGPLAENVLARWYAAAPIYALPAKYEPFGLSVLEAALAGCALVLGDIASLRELWDGAAVFVDPWDEAALARALGALIADPRRRRARLALSRSQAFRLSARRMGERYVTTYRELLAQESDQRDGAVVCTS
jgi:glycogen synthase